MKIILKIFMLAILASAIIGCTMPQTNNSKTQNTQAAADLNLASTTLVLQAENAAFSGGSVSTSTSGYTGTGYVAMSGTSGSYVEWTFTANTSASASIKFYYTSAVTASYNITVNGGSSVTKSFSSNSSFTSASKSFSLTAGTVKFRITAAATTASGIGIDRIEVTGDVSASGTTSSSTTSSVVSSSSSKSSSSSSSSVVSSSSSSKSSSSSSTAVSSATSTASCTIGYGTGTTGGAGGSSVTVSTGSALQAAIDGRATLTTPLIIYVNGTITLSNSSADKILLKGTSDSNMVQNISIIGVGTSGQLNGIGFELWRVKNIIFKNLKIHHVLYNTGDGDGLSIIGPASYIWVDHCEFYNSIGDLDGNGTAGNSGDKDYYDGLLDIKKAGAQNITISYNIFHDTYKTSLFGYTTSDARNWYVTICNNYYYNCNSRLPLIRGGAVHMYNNYYYNNGTISGSGTNNRCGLTNLIEYNYYKNSKDVIGWFYDDVTGLWDLGAGTSTDTNYYDNVTWTAANPSGSDILSTAASKNFADTGTFTPSYSYSKLAASAVPAYVTANAGVGK